MPATSGSSPLTIAPVSMVAGVLIGGAPLLVLPSSSASRHARAYCRNARTVVGKADLGRHIGRGARLVAVAVGHRHRHRQRVRGNDTVSSGVVARLSCCSDRYCSTVTTPVPLLIEIANAAWPANVPA